VKDILDEPETPHEAPEALDGAPKAAPAVAAEARPYARGPRLGGGQPCVIRGAIDKTLKEAAPQAGAATAPFPESARRPFRIGPITLATNLCLSPLAGYTDLAFRRLVRGAGAVGLATTEVVSSRALIHKSKRTQDFIRTSPDDRPLSVQIDGRCGEDLAEAARLLEQSGYTAIDINMGCPVPKLAENGGGASWTCDPSRAAGAVRTVTSAVKIPVTVKMRLGWDAGSITAPVLARACEESGAAAIFVHGRTRAQGFSGEVSRAGIASVVAAVTSVPVIGNGDIVSVEAARLMFAETGCAGVSLGRAALTDPWIFARIDAAIRGVPAPVIGFQERVAFIERHFALLLEQDGEKRAAIRFRKAGVWYGSAIRASREYRRRVGTASTAADVASIIEDLLAGKLQARRREGQDDEPRVPVPMGPISHW